MNRRGPILNLLPLAAVLMAAIALIFMGREFPSQDGPIHLYYAEVTRNLLLGTGLYADAFAIVHYLSPYILQTYLLAALDCVFDPLVSEKLLVCGYVVSFVLGFRYLLRSVSSEEESGVLVAAPFIFNYFVYAGNYNYVLGLSIVMWAAGYWMRHSPNLTLRHMCGIAAFIALLALTHPLALLTFLLFAGLQLVLDVAAAMAHVPLSGLVARYRRPFALLAGSSLTALWVSRFMTADNRAGGAGDLPSRAVEALLMWAISPVKTRSYRYFLVAVVGFAALAAVWGCWKLRGRKQLQPAAGFLVQAVIFCALGLFSPARVSGGTNLGNRLFLFGVLLLLASAASMRLPLWPRRSAAAVLCVGTALCFFHLYRVGARVNAELEPIFAAPPAAARSRIAWVTGGNTDPDFTHEPRYWAACHYIRRSNAVLANYGFLYLPYMNLGARQPGKCQFLDPIALPDRPSMQTCLSQAALQPDRPPIDAIVSASFDAAPLASAYGLQRQQYGSDGIDFYLSGPLRAASGDRRR